MTTSRRFSKPVLDARAPGGDVGSRPAWFLPAVALPGRDPGVHGTWSFQGGELAISVRWVQPRDGFVLDIDIGVELADASTDTITLRVNPDEGATAMWTHDEDVANVVIDPDTRLLAKWRIDRR